MAERRKMLIAALGIFILSLFLNAAGSQSIEWGIADEQAYETLAGEIKNQGAFWEFPAYYLSGQFKDTIRGPVYVWLLSLIHDGQHLNRGLTRGLNTIIGALAAVMVFLLVSQLWDRKIGLGAGIIAAVSNCTALYGGIVAVEPLLMIGALLAWYLCLKALQSSEIEDGYLIGGLVLTGVIYYVKAQTLILVPAIFVTGLVVEKLGFLRRKSLWIGLLIVLLLLSLNVVRNVNAFGEPFHNDNWNYQWLDHGQQFHEPNWQEKYGTPARYFERHTAGEFVQHMINGVLLQITTVGHDLFGPTRISHALGGTSMLVGSILFVAFIIGLAREPNRRWLIFHLIILGIYVLAFAHRSGMMNTMYARWYLPLIGMLTAYSAVGLREIWAGLRERLPAPRLHALRIVLWVAAAGYLLIIVRKALMEAGMAVWIVPD